MFNHLYQNDSNPIIHLTMRTYTLGTQYEFIVNYFYTNIDNDGRTKMWLSLSDGESARKFNVPAYPYQQTGFEGKTILCKVSKVLENGYPFLLQDKAEVIRNCYKDGETYWFSIGEKVIDPNSKRPYYRLTDRLNNIDWHRYYCSDQTELDGLVGFIVSIKGDYLDLTLSEDTETTTKPEETSPATTEIFQNPFGHEDNNHEWKSSLVFPAGSTDQSDPDVDHQVKVILKSIAGFQNAEGGLLYIGVTDNGEIRGIEPDYPYLDSGSTMTYQKNTDGFENRIRNEVNRRLGKTSLDNIRFKFYCQQSSKKVFCIIEVNKTNKPVYCDGIDVFKRYGNGYRQLRGDDITNLALEKANEKSAQAEFSRPMPDDCAEYNPNANVQPVAGNNVQVPVVKLKKDLLKRMDFYYMAFFKDNTFLYSKSSHQSDPNLLCEVRFNKIDGNLEYSRDLLAKCSKDGHVQFLQAYDVCKLGNPDERLKLNTDEILVVKVVHKYDFLKVLFNDGTNNRQKYIRVTSLFGRDTEANLKANMEPKDIKYEFKLKGNALIPKNYTLISVDVVHETLPDEIQFVSARSGASGIGSIVGSQDIDMAKY